MERGMPEIHIAVVISCSRRYCLSRTALTGTLPSLGSFLDDKLNEHSYIVPGLGDAGDLAYAQNYN
jgi:uracil phosphoribosyltransferase